ncbi:MAG TPA: hypothetical protein VK550_20915 [Polyangiaceae bacterium]|nr:hypothetical protein [Polyangiaceae bacterium]
MAYAYPRAVRRFFCLSSMCVGVAAANCSVYEGDPLPNSDASSGGRGGTAVDSGRGGASGSADSSTGGSTGGGGGTGGATGGNAGTTGGAAGSTGGTAGTGAAGKGGSAGASGTGGAGTGGSGVDGSAGSGGGSGSAGVSGAGGNAGAAGTGGAGGADGGAGTGGAAGKGGTAGAAGTGGTGASGGAAGAAGASGAGGSAGTAGAGGTADAAPDLPPPPGAVFAVGSFTKTTSTGNQVVTHTLGQLPKALILWTSGKTNETASAGFSFGIGVSDASTSVATSMEAADGVSPSASGRHMANKAITMVNANQSTRAEADISSWSASGFTLNWTTNEASAVVIHYLAIGGPQVSAKVVTWVAPASPGTKPVTGIGFQPEAVLHFNAGGAFITAPPAQAANAVFGMGAMDRTGGQWATMVGDTANTNPSTTSRAQQTDATIFTITDAPALTVTKEATFVSMDSGGFTVNFTANSSSTNQTQIFSLALGGLRAKAGFFPKSAGAQPASQSVTSPGFRPGVVLFSSYQSIAQTAAVAVPHARFGVGASDGPHEASSALAAADNGSPTNVDGIDKTSKVFLKVDNTSMAVNAEANMTSFDATGFTLNWTTNDAVATEIGFLALGAP